MNRLSGTYVTNYIIAEKDSGIALYVKPFTCWHYNLEMHFRSRHYGASICTTNMSLMILCWRPTAVPYAQYAIKLDHSHNRINDGSFVPYYVDDKFASWVPSNIAVLHTYEQPMQVQKSSITSSPRDNQPILMVKQLRDCTRIQWKTNSSCWSEWLRCCVFSQLHPNVCQHRVIREPWRCFIL